MLPISATAITMTQIHDSGTCYLSIPGYISIPGGCSPSVPLPSLCPRYMTVAHDNSLPEEASVEVVKSELPEVEDLIPPR